MTRPFKGVSVYKPKRRSRKTDPYLIAYREGGKRKTITGSTDHRISLAKAMEISLRLDAARLGLVDQHADSYARNRIKPLVKHLDDYEKTLTAQKRTGQYAQETKRLCVRIFTSAGMTHIEDIVESEIQRAIASLSPERAVKDAKLSLRSMDKAVRAVKSFFHWMKQDKRTPTHLTPDLEHYDPELDRRRIRRAVDEASIVHLIELTASRPFLGRMTGADRAIMYATAIGTGFRFGSLRTLTPESFDFSEDTAIVTVEARNWKGRKVVTNPLRDDLASMLKAWTKDKPKGTPIFPAGPRFNETFQRDLRAAGIPEHDASGHVFDFHAQRNQFISAVVRAAGLAVAQDLAHHSTPVLTKRYARMTFDDYDKALKGLPALKLAQQKKKTNGGAA